LGEVLRKAIPRRRMLPPKKKGEGKNLEGGKKNIRLVPLLGKEKGLKKKKEGQNILLFFFLLTKTNAPWKKKEGNSKKTNLIGTRHWGRGKN